MMPRSLLLLPLLLALSTSAPRKIILDQDCSGPATTNTVSALVLLLEADVELLGITISSGDGWPEASLAHCAAVVRMLGLSHRVPVVSGAVYPLSNTAEEAAIQFPGTLGGWKGAFGLNQSLPHVGVPQDYPEVPLFNSSVPILPCASLPGVSAFDSVANAAARFMLDQVRAFPGEVTILELAPATNLAAAISLGGTNFTRAVKELWVMGGSLHCAPNPTDPSGRVLCDDARTPKHEMNFWYDPAAMARVLQAPWGADRDGASAVRLVTADVGFMPGWQRDPRLVSLLATSTLPQVRYLSTCLSPLMLSSPMCDELVAVAWILSGDANRRLDSLGIGAPENKFVGLNTTHGYHYGDTLLWEGGAHDPPPPLPIARRVLLFRNTSSVTLDPFFEKFVALYNESAPPMGSRNPEPVTCEWE